MAVGIFWGSFVVIEMIHEFPAGIRSDAVVCFVKDQKRQAVQLDEGVIQSVKQDLIGGHNGLSAIQ